MKTLAYALHVAFSLAMLALIGSAITTMQCIEDRMDATAQAARVKPAESKPAPGPAPGIECDCDCYACRDGLGNPHCSKCKSGCEAGCRGACCTARAVAVCPVCRAKNVMTGLPRGTYQCGVCQLLFAYDPAKKTGHGGLDIRPPGDVADKPKPTPTPPPDAPATK